MLLTLYTVLMILLLFGLTIFSHELGHFLVARWCGLIVDVFSIGFGPALWKKKIGSVTYKIGVFPFGGYVALPQMDPSSNEKPAETDEKTEPREIPPVAPWKKILVAAAGVVGNMIFAVILAYIVFFVGKPSEPRERNCVVGYVDVESTAYAAGIRVGDEIKAVGGEPVANWNDFMMLSALRKEVVVTVSSGDTLRQVTLPTVQESGLNMVPGMSWVNYCAVAGVVPGSSAEKAGLKPGDVMTEFNGQKLFSRQQLIKLVDQFRNQEVPALIRRSDRVVEVKVTPAYNEKEKRALIGIIFNTLDVDFDQVSHPRVGDQIRSHASAIGRFLRALMTPKEARAASQAAGGPVAIFVMYWLAVKSSLMIAVWFTGFLNVNLAVLNILPLPVLDGGHIVLSVWECITRKPVSAKIVTWTWNLFATLLIAVFLLLTYRDVVRLILPLFTHRTPVAAEAVTNAPPPAPSP